MAGWFSGKWTDGSWWAGLWWAGGAVTPAGGGGAGPWAKQLDEFHRKRKIKEEFLRRALTQDEEEAILMVLLASEL